MPERKVGPELPRRHGPDRGVAFYLDALRYAQGLWLEGKPAQAILQLNKALSADLRGDEKVLVQWPLPFDAMQWILKKAADGSCGFLGNPVRHFQHLATRMSGPRREIRVKRAWRCFWIARQVLDGDGRFPMDGRQLVREGIFIPRPERIPGARRLGRAAVPSPNHSDGSRRPNPQCHGNGG